MKHEHKLENLSKLKNGLILFLLISIITSCTLNDRTEKNLSPKEIEFIKETCKLDKDETILLFETNAGFSGYKQGGNFITDKRVVSYWIEDEEKIVETAYYYEIDSIKLIDKNRAVTLASYLLIYKSDGLNFELFIDADSCRLNSFYNKTINVWKSKIAIE